MLVVRRDDDAALVVGVRRSDELAGLVLTGIGLLTVSILIYLFSEFNFRELIENEIPIQVAGYGLAMGFVGLVLLFFQQHFMVDRHQKLLIHARNLRGTRHWNADGIERVLVIQSAENFGYLLVEFKDRTDLEITRGALQQCNLLACHFARALEVPLNKEERPRYQRKPPSQFRGAYSEKAR